MPERAIVLTTISGPNACMRALAEGARKHDASFIVAGDTKSPADFSLDGCEFYSIDRQCREFPDLCSVLPTRHYVRKNVAYLAAIRAGAEEIQETDDDNMPRPAFWDRFPMSLAVEAVAVKPWFNVYSLFTGEPAWPRGFPLEFIQNQANGVTTPNVASRGLIIQGLADDNPDVDAVYRLTRTLPLSFEHRPPVVLRPGTWCPFNSQNTVFRREAFPLLYLPSKCSFRMTDIWRSFVAQRCLWELDEGVVFHSPTVYQERNEHSLLKDFEDEVPGYLLNDRIRRVLEPLRLDGNDLMSSLTMCYEALVREQILPREEMPIVQQWCQALQRLS